MDMPSTPPEGVPWSPLGPGDFGGQREARPLFGSSHSFAFPGRACLPWAQESQPSSSLAGR